VSDILDIWHLETRRIGRRVLVYSHIDSTNSHALQMSGEPDADGLALLADVQTAGRGQHGRKWLARPRSSVLMSVLLFPPEEVNRPALLIAWAAVSVAEVARHLTGVTPRIKWPNDVLLHERKVAGILIEQSRFAGRHVTVAGIGLNVTQTEEEFAAAELPEATSLGACGATVGDPRAVARLLLERLDETYDRLCRGDRGELEQRWRERLGFLGDEVIVELPKSRVRGQVVECGFDGVVLRTADGELWQAPPESILHIRRP
jgi:BirA family biotin operon repressor/biotin-[acetyl-CoA-carboxylase] ligase